VGSKRIEESPVGAPKHGVAAVSAGAWEFCKLLALAVGGLVATAFISLAPIFGASILVFLLVGVALGKSTRTLGRAFAGGAARDRVGAVGSRAALPR
jgi:hypothetical protein